MLFPYVVSVVLSAISFAAFPQFHCCFSSILVGCFFCILACSLSHKFSLAFPTVLFVSQYLYLFFLLHSSFFSFTYIHTVGLAVFPHNLVCCFAAFFLVAVLVIFCSHCQLQVQFPPDALKCLFRKGSDNPPAKFAISVFCVSCCICLIVFLPDPLIPRRVSERRLYANTHLTTISIFSSL